MSHALPTDLIAEVEAFLGETCASSRPIGGGCIHHGTQVHMASGQAYFLKYNAPQERGNFEAERLGLHLLARADALPVPEPLAVGATDGHAYLLMHWIETGRPAADYWENLGQGLALQHQHSQASFGLDHDNYIGALPQPNQPTDTWAAFFISQRLQPMIRRASQQDLLPDELRRDLESLFPRIEELFPREKPALLHGDLWGGNLLCNAAGQAAIIDPAVYYGHREMELAFMTLFDRQPPAFFEAYHATYPLAPDWRSRIDLCNLYPLLVHVNLFGRGYLSSLQSALRGYL